MKLTIIIPVYNVRETLRRCVESILGMDMVDYEIVLVDDGSTDGSDALCNQLAQGNNRIRVISRKNGGLSAARNTGLKRSHSEYVTFVDSDDYLDPQTYPKLLAILREHTEYDILEYPAMIAYGSKHQHRLALSKREYTDMKEYWMEGRAYSHAYAWNKIYRRELFNGIRFPEGVAFEDVFTLPQLLDKAQVVATTSQGLYYYCYNDKGITATAGGEELAHLLAAHTEYINEHTTTDDRRTRAFARYFAHVLNIALDIEGTETRHQDTVLLREIARDLQPVNMKTRILRLFGFKTLYVLNNLWHKIVPRKHS